MREANFYFDGQTEGIMVVIGALLKKEGLQEADREMIEKKMKELELNAYLDRVLELYFPN